MRHVASRSALSRGTALAASLLLLVGAVPVLAGQPPTTITITIDFEVGETFTATGPVLCPSGSAVSTQDQFRRQFPSRRDVPPDEAHDLRQRPREHIRDQG